MDKFFSHSSSLCVFKNTVMKAFFRMSLAFWDFSPKRLTHLVSFDVCTHEVTIIHDWD